MAEDDTLGVWWCTYASVNWIIIDSGNGLAPVRCQAIARPNADLLSLGLSGTNFSEILIKNID